MFKDKKPIATATFDCKRVDKKIAVILLGLIIILITILIISPSHADNVKLFLDKNGLALSKSPPQRLVFIDFGANRGDSFRVFMEEPNTKYNYTYAKPDDREYREFESHLFEANPFFNKFLVETKEEFKNRKDKKFGPVIIYPSTIVYTKDTVLPFFVDTLSVEHDFWGSSVLDTYYNPNHPAALKKDLVAIDAARFLLLNFLPEDFVVVKMDIEGAEYDILPHLIEMNAHYNIDHLYVEYHPNFINQTLLPEKADKVNKAIEIMKKAGVHCPHYDSYAR
jgi:FkbM family methyltransferase